MEVFLPGNGNAIHLHEPFQSRMRPELASRGGDALTQADEPALTMQRQTQRDLLGRVDVRIEPAHRIECRARAKQKTPERHPHPSGKPNLDGNEHPQKATK